MTAPSTLHVVRGGDHSLNLRKRDLKAWGIEQGDSDNQAMDAVQAFLA